MSSKGLEMPVSGSDKLELPVLGCRFSEKAEHLPIKKRRFLFRTPSPPHNTAPSQTTESATTSLNSSNQEVKPQPQPQPLTGSLKVASKDICGISLGSYGIKSLKPPATVKLEANSVNIPNVSPKETGLHLSTMDNSISTSDNQVTSQGHKSADCDERLNWDLNTVMAWEESPELDHTPYAEGKKGNPKVCKQEQVCGSAPESISNKLLTNLRSLTQSTHGQEPVELKPKSNHINKMLFPVISTPPSHVTVNSIKPTEAVPRIVKSEYPPCPMPAGIGLSLGYSIPLVYSRAKDNVKNHATTSTTQTSENESLNLSLVTVASLENQVHQSGTSFEEEDDKAKVKRVITSSCITSENLIDKMTTPTQSTIGSLAVIQSPEVEKQLSSVQIKPEKSPSTPPSASYNNKEVSIDNNLGFENSQLDMIQESEVDNVEEFSVGYDSQFEDGEVRESSIQTWEGEGSEGDNRETEHDTDNNNNMGTTTATTCVSLECAPESSSRIRSSEIASQKGTDEISISSVLLPEKPDTSENVSNSQPNETDTQEVSIKDESESNQWKMNVSGSDDFSNVSKMKEVTSMKLYKREPSTRDSFINRGSRFRMQGYSSSNGDESGSRRREVRPFRRGNTKFTTHVVRPSNRGGATWNRDRVNRDPPFFRENPTNEIPLEENDDIIGRPGPPYPTRGPTFRTRVVGNREEDDFRARLGLRPAGDTRFVPNQGRSIRYNGFEEPLEYSHSFPRPPPRRCFSPTEQRRENDNHNHPCVRLHSGSTSPLRSRTRSRSPRIRRLRSPDYRFEADGYNNNNNNNNNSPRWVKYKRPSGFDRSPPPPIGERLTFYDSSRKKNENYGRFSDAHGGVVMDHGYRRGGGGFVKRHEIGRSVKHMEYDDEDDGYGLEFSVRGRGRGRGNPKPYNSNNGTDTRFSRRGNPREERENW